MRKSSILAASFAVLLARPAGAQALPPDATLPRFLLLVAAAVSPRDVVVPVEEEPDHRTVFKNDYVQAFRVTLAPGMATGFHIHAHDDGAVRLSRATVVSQKAGEEPGEPETNGPGFVSTRENEGRHLVHRVRNVGTTPFDVIDVQVLSRPPGPAVGPISPPAAENAKLRVYRYELAPGASSPRHAHARPYLLVAVTDASLRMAAPDGQAMEHPVKTGDLHWVGTPVTHTFTNLGAERAILVEFELR